MFKHIKQFFTIIILVAILVLPYLVFAASLKENLDALSGAAGYKPADETTISQLAGTAVSGFLSILGLIFIILIVYAGHNWMVAAGNEEKLSKAKETLWRATIGLAIVVGAYAIWVFVFSKLIS